MYALFPAIRRIIFFSAFFLAGTAIAHAAMAEAPCNAVPSQPYKVFFYPDEAQVEVEESLSPVTLPSGENGFLIPLPSQAKRDSFLVSVDGTPAQGYYWLDEKERDAALFACRNIPLPNGAVLPENETSPERKAILEKIAPLAEELALTEGRLAAAEARLTLWKKTLEEFGPGRKSSFSEADEAAKLDAAYAENYPQLHVSAQKERRALEDVQRRLAKAEQELQEFDHDRGVSVIAIPVKAGSKAPQKLSYGYILPASCQISYRLDARPDSGEIGISQDVVLYQNSGLAWKDVDLYVSTVRRDKTLRPSLLPQWQVALASKAPQARARMESKATMKKELDMMALSQVAVSEELAPEPIPAAPAPAPIMEEKGTFRLWGLGKQNVMAGAPVHLSLASDTYKAEYYYTLRPISSPKGFLTADLALPSSLELPPGMAQFSVDGAVMGRQIFSFNGDKGIIFFGSDPQVTVTMRDMKQTSGEQGFFSKEQTRSWHWQITVKNTRPKPVDIVLEDPAPVTRNDNINIITQSSPRPEEVVNEPRFGGAHIYRWKAALPSGESLVVKHEIQVIAPLLPDMEIAPGR